MGIVQMTWQDDDDTDENPYSVHLEKPFVMVSFLNKDFTVETIPESELALVDRSILASDVISAAATHHRQLGTVISISGKCQLRHCLLDKLVLNDVKLSDLSDYSTIREGNYASDSSIRHFSCL
jgi:hypothetical protein